MSVKDGMDVASLFAETEFSGRSLFCLDGKISQRSRFVVVGGGNSDIWKGMIEETPVAIKVLRCFIGAKERIKIKIRKRLWREYLTWSKLSHTNIAPCMGFSYDFMEHTPHQIPALISPWMVNGTILSYLETNENINVLRLILGITEGLRYLHQNSIVHGDIRGGNILISNDGSPCLTDFGLSRILEGNLGITTTSEAAGTLRWMAPELFDEGQRVTKESDVWAFGMTVLEITTQDRPYADFPNDPAVVGQIQARNLPKRPHPSAAPDLNDSLWKVCCLCWKYYPISRLTMDDISEYLVSHTKGNQLQHFIWTSLCEDKECSICLEEYDHDDLFQQGIGYQQIGKYGRSLICFKRLLDNSPTPGDVWFQMGLAYERQEDHHCAKKVYECAIEVYPMHVKALQKLGLLYQKPGLTFRSIEHAIQCFKKALESDSSNVQSWYLLGRAHMSEKLYHNAFDAYQQAIYRDGSHPAVWCSIGILYFKSYQSRVAFDAYRRAVCLEPNIFEVWFNIGSLYEHADNHLQDAIEAYTKASQLDPTDTTVSSRLKLLKQAQLSKQDAIAIPEPLEMDPIISSFEGQATTRFSTGYRRHRSTSVDFGLGPVYVWTESPPL